MRRRTLLSTGVLAAALLVLPALPAVADAPALSGTVTLSGTPRADVPVAWYSPGGRVVTATRTDAAGHYSLPAPAAGAPYFLAANVAAPLTRPHPSVAGWQTSYTGAAGTSLAAAPLVTAAVSTGADRVVDVVVPKAVRVSGRARAFAGRVVSLLTADRTTTASTRASSTGAWSFLVTPGTYRLGAESDRNWLPYTSRPFVVGRTPVVKRSSPTRTAVLQGRLTSGGRPVAGVPVRWNGPYLGDEAPEALVHTDANGRYRLRALVPGHFVLTFGNAGDATDRSPYVRRTRQRDLAPGTTTTLNVAMTRGTTIAATVATSTGAKQWSSLLTRAGILVRTTANTAHTAAADNRLRLRGLPKGTYVLRLTDGLRTLRRTLHVTAAGTRDLGRLRPTATPLTLSGNGPAGASVTASQGSLFVTTRIGADGVYRLPGLLPGRYAVVTSGRGHRPTTVHTTMTASAVLDVALGAVEPSIQQHVTGTVLAGSVPLPLADLALANGPNQLIRDGRLTATLTPNTYLVSRIVLLDSSVFPSGTPYSVSWKGPDIRVVSGADTDLGTVQLRISG